jgi:hypothetical protein
VKAFNFGPHGTAGPFLPSSVASLDARCTPLITYYWTVPLILDHSYLVGYLTNSKIAETKALEALKS